MVCSVDIVVSEAHTTLVDENLWHPYNPGAYLCKLGILSVYHVQQVPDWEMKTRLRG